MKITKFSLRWRQCGTNKKALEAAWDVYAVDDLLMIENPVTIQVMNSLTTGGRKAVRFDVLASINNEEGYAKGVDPSEPAAIDAALYMAGVEFDQDLVTNEDVTEALTLIARKMGYNNDILVKRTAIWPKK